MWADGVLQSCWGKLGRCVCLRAGLVGLGASAKLAEEPMALSPGKRLWEFTAVDSPSGRLCRGGRALSAGHEPSLYAALEHLSPPGDQGITALLQIGLVSVTACKSVSWPRVGRMVGCPSRSSWVQIVFTPPQKSRQPSEGLLVLCFHYSVRIPCCASEQRGQLSLPQPLVDMWHQQGRLGFSQWQRVFKRGMIKIME